MHRQGRQSKTRVRRVASLLTVFRNSVALQQGRARAPRSSANAAACSAVSPKRSAAAHCASRTSRRTSRLMSSQAAASPWLEQENSPESPKPSRRKLSGQAGSAQAASRSRSPAAAARRVCGRSRVCGGLTRARS